jgi:DMSO/TMAO reductase YedYZ molybdopterin-dependent catalytic subunit
MSDPRQVQLPPGQQLAAPGKWPAIGEREPAAGGAWTVTICAEVEHPQSFSLADLQAMPQNRELVDIHCVTRWSKLGVVFGGVPLDALLAPARPKPSARFVSFLARSERGHSTSLPLDEGRQLKTLVALEADGRPLDELHGGPVRVVVPGRYFYKSLKWLERIELLQTDRLGYWESVAGYHNAADPWREQRYLAPGLSRQQMARALAGRDFSGQDLRSLDARGHDLSGLIARSAILRDADFRNCRLQGAAFDGANLSNAHFQGADLRRASFASADAEGADFCGADLRDVNFSGASLVGASFCAENSSGEAPRLAAAIDRSTRIDRESLDQLTPLQAAFVAAAIG